MRLKKIPHIRLWLLPREPLANIEARLENAIDLNLSKIIAGRGVDQPEKLDNKLRSILKDLHSYIESEKLNDRPY